MPPKTPGIDLNRMKMPPEEKKRLSDDDLSSQVEREVYNQEVIEHRAAENIGSDIDVIKYQKEIANEIRDDALEENYHRARVKEEILKVRNNGHELSPDEETKLAEIHKKLEDAYSLIEESKK